MSTIRQSQEELLALSGAMVPALVGASSRMLMGLAAGNTESYAPSLRP